MRIRVATLSLLGCCMLAGCAGGSAVSSTAITPTAPAITTQSSEAVPEPIESSTPSPSSSAARPLPQPLPAWDSNDIEGFGEAIVASFLATARTAGVEASLDPQDDVRLVTPDKIYTCSALQGGEEDKRLVGSDYSERPAAVWCGADNSQKIYLHELALRAIHGEATGGSAEFAILVATGAYILDANGKSAASVPCGAGFLAGALAEQGVVPTAQLHAWRNLLPSADQPFYDNGLTGLAAC